MPVFKFVTPADRHDGKDVTLIRRLSVVLSPQQIAEFHRNGFLVLDLRFEEVLLDSVISGVETYYDHSATDSYYAHGSRIQDAWRFDAGVRSIALDKRVLEVLRQLFGRKPKAFQTLNLRRVGRSSIFR